MTFQLVQGDPYRDIKSIKIPVQQLGLAKIVIVRKAELTSGVRKEKA